MAKDKEKDKQAKPQKEGAPKQAKPELIMCVSCNRGAPWSTLAVPLTLGSATAL